MKVPIFSGLPSKNPTEKVRGSSLCKGNVLIQSARVSGANEYGATGPTPPPLERVRGSLRGRFSETFGGFQRFMEIFRSSEVFREFSEALSETLSEADFPLRGSQSCCP